MTVVKWSPSVKVVLPVLEPCEGAFEDTASTADLEDGDGDGDGVSTKVIDVVVTITDVPTMLVSVTTWVEVEGLGAVEAFCTSDSSTGHIVVDTAMISVVTDPNRAGQFVTSGAQDVTV
jgi:hypothetical protein